MTPRHAASMGPGPERAPGDTHHARTLTAMLPYLWPAGRPDLRVRVIAAIVALIAAKGVTVATPFFFKDAVDGLAAKGDPTVLLVAIPIR